MLETLFLLAQLQFSEAYCPRFYPLVVCAKYQSHGKHYLLLTNGNSRTEVNRCTYLGNIAGNYYAYIPLQKWCPSEP